MKRLLIILLLITITSCAPPPVDKETAECIGSKSTLYTATGCIACEKQEKLFGESYQYLHALDCKKDPKKCVEKEIQATPTWIINGKHIKGVQSIETLKTLTDCQ